MENLNREPHKTFILQDTKIYMKASFVIVNYNRKNELLITIAKTKEVIKHNPSQYEIVIVDNASSDESVEAVKSNFPDVVLIENPQNTGAPAWNLGFAKAKGQYFIILDDDSHLESGLEEALKYLDDHREVGVLALNITGGSYETSDWDDLSDTIGFIGCGAIFRKETYDKIGGYPEWIFLYANEWELGLRCYSAGYKVRFFKNSSVIHRTSKINRTNKRLRFFTTRNEMGIVYKYFSHNKWKYLIRVWINNMKYSKTEGLLSAYYSFQGGLEFFKIKNEIPVTPVSKQVQDWFASTFWGTKPVFAFLKKRMSKLGG